MGPYDVFGRVLRLLLRERGWTAAELARALERHRGSVSRWVNGETLPERAAMLRLADILMLSAEERQRLFSAYLGEG